MTYAKIRTESVAWQEVDDDIIVLDEDRSLYLRLRGAGAVVWPQLLSGATIDELADALVEAFAIDRLRALNDAAAFVDDLSTHKLLEIDSSPSGQVRGV